MSNSKVKQLIGSPKRKKAAIMNDQKNKMRGAMDMFVLKCNANNGKHSD